MSLYFFLGKSKFGGWLATSIINKILKLLYVKIIEAEPSDGNFKNKRK